MFKLLDTRYHHGDGFNESYCLSIFSIITLVVFLVAGISYATYVFIDATGISDMAGIHITKNLSLATTDLRGKLYSNESKHIKNWIIYTDNINGFEIKYPNDLVMSKAHENGLELKKMVQSNNAKQESLLYTFMINSLSENGDFTIEEFVQKRYPEWQGTGKKDIFGGKDGLRTGVFKSVSGIFKDVVCWKTENGFICLESKYYLENNAEYVNIFDKVVSEVSIM